MSNIFCFDSLILGLIQGITEIVPVSSSVHLYLAAKIFNLSGFTFALKIMLHVGSLIVLLVYFHHEVKDMCSSFFSKSKKIKDTFFLQLFFGTIPVVLFAVFAKNVIKGFNSVGIMAGACIVFGCCLFVFDKIFASEKQNSRGRISLIKSFIVGLFQTIAVFPGVSRLGICITACRMLSLPRKDSVRFSLMLAIPSIAGSFIFELKDAFEKESMSNLFSESALIGLCSAVLTGFLFIKLLIKFMEKKGFGLIAVYRIIIGLLSFCF